MDDLLRKTNKLYNRHFFSEEEIKNLIMRSDGNVTGEEVDDLVLNSIATNGGRIGRMRVGNVYLGKDDQLWLVMGWYYKPTEGTVAKGQLFDKVSNVIYEFSGGFEVRNPEKYFKELLGNVWDKHSGITLMVIMNKRD